MRLRYSKQALKALRRMQPRQARAIMAQLQRLAENPATPGLVGRSGYRLRIGEWRAIYLLDDDRVDVLVIAPRGKVYDS
jgi:mRNA interferase RelE/StbE